MSIPSIQNKGFLATLKGSFRKKDKPSIEKRTSDTARQTLGASTKTPMQIKRTPQRLIPQAPLATGSISHEDQLLEASTKPSMQTKRTPQITPQAPLATGSISHEDQLLEASTKPSMQTKRTPQITPQSTGGISHEESIENKPIPLPRSNPIHSQEKKPDLLQSIKKAKENLGKRSHNQQLPQTEHFQQKHVESILKKDIEKPSTQKRVSFKNSLDDPTTKSSQLTDKPASMPNEIHPPKPPPRSLSTQLSEKKPTRTEEKSELDREFEAIDAILEECQNFITKKALMN